MTMRDVILEGSKNFDHLGLFNTRLNLKTPALSVFPSVKNALLKKWVSYVLQDLILRPSLAAIHDKS